MEAGRRGEAVGAGIALVTFVPLGFSLFVMTGWVVGLRADRCAETPGDSAACGIVRFTQYSAPATSAVFVAAVLVVLLWRRRLPTLIAVGFAALWLVQLIGSVVVTKDV